MKQNLFDRLLESGESLLVDLLEQARDRVGEVGKYGSPIEHTFAVAAATLCATRYPEIGFHPSTQKSIEDARNIAALLRDPPLPKEKPLWGCVFPQVRIDPYRVDFLILYSKGLSGCGGVVVECDGHAFHERNKEQAAKDKARDRFLQEEGFKVFRFTGSEIWKDPFACADKVLQIAVNTAIDSECARHLHSEGDLVGAMRALSWVQ